MQVAPSGTSIIRTRSFADPAATTVSWFPVARSRQIRVGRAVGAEAPGRRLALWRDSAGALKALDARCPHLGADLAGGRVVANDIVCPFHGWRFASGGSCVEAPGWQDPPARRARTVPVQERWGLVWVFNASKPLFDLPNEPPGRWRIIRPPSQTIRTHPHLVIGNGLDPTHFDALHGLEPTAEPDWWLDPPFRVSLRIRGRPRSAALRSLAGDEIQLLFSTTGGHLATVDVEAPIRFRVLFTATPTPEGCRTQVVLFMPPSPVRFGRALVGLYALLHDDARVLEALRFRRAFTPADAPLAAFADLVDLLPHGWPTR